MQRATLSILQSIGNVETSDVRRRHELCVTWPVICPCLTFFFPGFGTKKMVPRLVSGLTNGITSTLLFSSSTVSKFCQWFLAFSSAPCVFITRILSSHEHIVFGSSCAVPDGINELEPRVCQLLTLESSTNVLFTLACVAIPNLRMPRRAFVGAKVDAICDGLAPVWLLYCSVIVTGMVHTGALLCLYFERGQNLSTILLVYTTRWQWVPGNEWQHVPIAVKVYGRKIIFRLHRTSGLMS